MIPKIIHHVWPSDTQPFDDPRMIEWRQSWMRHYPDWDFGFWRIFDLPLDRFSPAGRSIVMDGRNTVVVKSGAIRFELLRIYGGVYVDTDMECRFGLLNEFPDESVLVAMVPDKTVWACIMGFVPNDPVCVACGEAVNDAVLSDPADANSCRPKRIIPEDIIGPIVMSSGYPILAATCITVPPLDNGVAPLVHHRTGRYPGGWQLKARYS